MVLTPSTSSRRAVGRATTKAVVRGLEIYGPHAIGFMLFVLPAACVTSASYLLFGKQVAAGVVAIAFSLGVGGLFRSAWPTKMRSRTRR